MRTDLLKPRGLLLAAAMLAAGSPALRAQDTMAPPAEAVATPARGGDRVILNGDVTVERDEVVAGRVVVMRGDLRVEGRVTGNVTVGAGDLAVARGARVEGDVRVAGGTLRNDGQILGDAYVAGGTLINGGTITGEMRVEGDREARGSASATAAAAKVRVQHGWLGSFGRGMRGLVSTLSLALVLAGVGAGLVFYGYPRLRVMNDVLRADPLKAGAAGLAAAVLVVPVFLVLVFALVVTIIGIPLLLVAVPLYPLLVAAAGGFGLVAVAHALGERTAEQRGSWERHLRNGYTYVFTGLGVMLAPLVLANLLRLTGFLGWLGGVLEFFAWMAIWTAAIVGTGAVLLTRGGTRRPGPIHPYDPIFDADPAFDAEPAGGARA